MIKHIDPLVSDNSNWLNKRLMLNQMLSIFKQQNQRMAQFLEQLRTHFSIILKEDYLSLTLINPNISADIMTQIKNEFKSHSNIRKEEIVILQTPNFDDQLLAILAQSLPLSLTQLSLDFTGCQSLRGPGFVDLFQRISLMENLSKLHFDFSEIYDINDFVIEGMSMLFESLDGLTDLYLDLYEVDQITEDGYLMLAESISSIQNLQKIYIDLSANPNLTEDALELLFSGFSTKLTSLCFRILDIEQIGGGSFFKLAESLSKMTYLNTLKLAISSFDNLNHKSVYSLIKSMGTANSLINFDVNFSNIHLPEKMLSYFVLPSILQHLSLDVSCNRNLSDRDIVCLIPKIPITKSLKSVTFNFDFCTKMSEDAIQSLLEKVCQNPCLMKLSLPERKFSPSFVTNCTTLIQKSCCRNSMIFLFLATEEQKKVRELQNFGIYKNKERTKRNILLGSELMRRNNHLKHHQNDVLRLFLP